MPQESPTILSVVIPAYNESRNLPGTLAKVRSTFSDCGFDGYEIVVSDDASTDDTAVVAEKLGAKVVYSGKRNIGATRNVGASHAVGEYILFLDADTYFEKPTGEALLKTIRQGVVGGGAPVRWSEPVPWHANLPIYVWNAISRHFKHPCGSFFFVKRDLFEAVGGFDEQFYAAEELVLARKLKKHGKLVILPFPILSSPRKVYQFTPKEMFGFFLRWVASPKKSLQNREGLDYWYARRDS
jgi:glycosyltransferase involved in cell wall biosynthesis